MKNTYKNLKLTPLGGLNNKNYLFNFYGSNYVLRLPDKNKDSNFLKEATIINKLKPLNITPKFTFIDKNTGVFVSKFIDDSLVTEEVSNDFKFLDSFACSLKEFHSLKCNYIFDPFKEIKDNIDFLIANNFTFPSEFMLLIKKLNNLEKHLKNNITLGLCHNDLNPSNILYKNNKVYFIDFEYTAMSDIYYDIATFCWLLKPESKAYFLKSYFGKNYINYYDKLNDYLFVVKMWNISWSYKKSLFSSSEYDYKKGGDFIVNELLKNINHI